jgi:hypothetical protein
MDLCVTAPSNSAAKKRPASLQAFERGLVMAGKELACGASYFFQQVIVFVQIDDK